MANGLEGAKTSFVGPSWQLLQNFQQEVKLASIGMEKWSLRTERSHKSYFFKAGLGDSDVCWRCLRFLN